MNLQEEYNKMPPPLRAMVRANRNKERMFLLYLIETQHDRTQEILELAGVDKPKACKKCYGRYKEGNKYPDAMMVDGEMVKGRRVVVLCRCVYKQLEGSKKLEIEWERKDETGEDRESKEPIRPTSETSVDRGEEDKRCGEAAE